MILAHFNHILSYLHVQPKYLRPNPQMVLWTKSPTGWFKLNVDGSCKGNLGSCGDGGIFHDEFNDLKVAFSKKFKNETNNGAELYDLVSGIRLCKTLAIQNIIIETNSELVVGWLRKN